jgi:hypothetical protein
MEEAGAEVAIDPEARDRAGAIWLAKYWATHREVRNEQ